MGQQSSGGDAPRACTVGDPKEDKTIEDKMLALEAAVKELAKTSKETGPRGRKPISEFKVIQNVAPLSEDKQKFREWSNRFVKAMDQVDPLCERGHQEYHALG